MACECRITWTMLKDGAMGYRRTADPGCEECEPEPEPLAMIVDRYLQPVHRRHVVLVRGSRLSRECFANATPAKRDVSLDWDNNRYPAEGESQGTSLRRVNRPAVKVEGQWLRRDPSLVVMV